MNERIRELMNEAVSFRLDPDSGSYEAQVCPEDLEAFAELIIQECAQVASDFVPGYGLVPFSKRFNEHYGVK